VNPIIHAEISWLTGQWLPERRDRILITLAGLAPDLDGLTLLGGEDLYGKYHHVLFHGYVGALITTAVCVAFARQRWKVAALACLAFHLHLLCDLAGSGPGWPILYFWPTSDRLVEWSGQWDLASWQNSVIGLGVTLLCLACALWRRRTFVEVFSTKADAEVTRTVRHRLLGEKA
jgi:hypothetical protein